MQDKGDLTLDRILRARGALPREVLLDLGIRICDAVQAHWDGGDGAGPDVSRDLEPSTIHVKLDGSVPPSDIGLSAMGEKYGDETAVYIAPEAREGHVGPSADVFVLGAILYEMATADPLFKGRRAKSGDQMTKGLANRLKQAGIPELHDGALKGFGTVLYRCLSVDRARRWPSPGDLARALRVVQMESSIPDADLDSFLVAAASVSVGSPFQVDMNDEGLDLATMDEDEHGNWSIPTAVPSPSGHQRISLQQSTGQHELPADIDEPPASQPWTSSDAVDETDAMIRARMDQSRITRVDRTTGTKTLEEEPTFGKAVRWFIKRVVLVLVLLLVLVFAAAYLGIFPGGTERLVAKGYGALPAGVSGAVPEGWVTGTTQWWTDRPGQDVATPMGAKILPLLPENLRSELSAEAPEPPPTPGDITFEGVVAAAEGWVEPAEDVAEGESGRLKLTTELGGRPRGEKVSVVARRAGTEDVVAEFSAAEPATLAAAHYDLALTYRESEHTEPITGWIRGARVSAGHLSAYLVTLEAPIGFVDVTIEVVVGTEEEEALEGISAEDAVRSVHLDAWREPAGGKPTGEPDFSGPAGHLIGLDIGRWRVRATVKEEGRADAFAWFRNVPVDKGEKVVLKRLDLQRGEELEPAGPGIRIVATNGGRDVSDHVRVMAFPPKSKPSTAVLSASGPAAYYFGVPTGTWDVYVVYVPNPEEPELRAEQMISVTLAPGQVVRRTVEMGLPIAHLGAELWNGEEDLTEAIRLLVLRKGADFEGATRLVDEEGRGPHPVAPGEYDVYVQAELEEGWRTAAFPDVTLKAGGQWSQRLEQAEVEWRQ
ncbi:MAG: hypothetical protein GY898_21970 [Proteobacteria bacterium]|nr:hypothetical protein [Pseudomonadota bacterium]